MKGIARLCEKFGPRFIVPSKLSGLWIKIQVLSSRNVKIPQTSKGRDGHQNVLIKRIFEL